MKIDFEHIKKLAEKLSETIPADVKMVKTDLQLHFREILQAQLSKLDIVTREEFDVQKKVLAKTRTKLEQLENCLKEIEKK